MSETLSHQRVDSAQDPEDFNRLFFDELLPLAARMLLRLFRAFGRPVKDLREAESALLDALSSLRRRDKQGDFQGLTSAHALAYQCARVSYNRWRRKKRSESKETTGTDLDFASVPAREALPDEQVIREEYRGRLETTLVRVLEDLKAANPGYAKIVSWYLEHETDITQSEIARDLSVSQATVSRALSLFHDLCDEESQKLTIEDQP